MKKRAKKGGPGVTVPFQGSLVQYRDQQQVNVGTAEDSSWVKFLGIPELRTVLLYKALFVEFIGTTLLVFTTCATVVSSLNYGNFPILMIAVMHVFIISTFIISMARSSGGHLNPMISFATVITGFTSPVRAFLYIISQSIGAILGASILRGILDDTPFNLGACTMGNLPKGRALLGELMGSLVILFIAFGTALDTSQREVFGPIFGPFFVSITIAFVIFAGGGLFPGWLGPIGNPARCLGPAVASNMYDGHWVYWVGPFIAAIIIGCLYKTMPPKGLEWPKEEKKTLNDHELETVTTFSSNVEQSKDSNL